MILAIPALLILLYKLVVEPLRLRYTVRRELAASLADDWRRAVFEQVPIKMSERSLHLLWRVSEELS